MQRFHGEKVLGRGHTGWSRTPQRRPAQRLRAAPRAQGVGLPGWVWISMSGNGAEKALQAYAAADFCLQPPGDTLPRPGVVDAISVGCVPVVFHPAQRTLWPAHWRDPENSSLLFDFTGGAPRPRIRDPKVYAAQAASALQALLSVSPHELERLRRGVAAAAPRLVYGLGDGGASPSAAAPDAVDVLVESMRPLRRAPDEAAYARQLEARTAMIEAQRRYELSRRARRRSGN